jgi:hypothetical protein
MLSKKSKRTLRQCVKKGAYDGAISFAADILAAILIKAIFERR